MRPKKLDLGGFVAISALIYVFLGMYDSSYWAMMWIIIPATAIVISIIETYVNNRNKAE